MRGKGKEKKVGVGIRARAQKAYFVMRDETGDACMRRETMRMDGVRRDMSMCKNKKTDRDPKRTATTTAAADTTTTRARRERSGGGGWSDSPD